MLQTNTIEYTLKYFNDFYDKFINFKLDAGYYRDFDSYSMFRIYRKKDTTFGMPYIDNDTLRNNRNLININCNIKLLRDVYSVLVDIYFNKKRG